MFVCQKLTLADISFFCTSLPISVTRLGDLLDFGQVLKPLAKINLTESPLFVGNFSKMSKFIIFLVKSSLGNFYRYLAIFSGRTVANADLSKSKTAERSSSERRSKMTPKLTRITTMWEKIWIHQI